MISGLQIMSVDTMFGHVKFSLSQRNIGRNPVGMQRQVGPRNFVSVSPGEAGSERCYV